MEQNEQLKQLQFEMQIDSMKKGMAQHIALCEVAAEALFEYHRSLQSKGFTAAESLQIVIAHGLRPGGNCGN